MKSYLLAVDAFEIDVAESKGQYLFRIVQNRKIGKDDWDSASISCSEDRPVA
jgi:hypothetical protein